MSQNGPGERRAERSQKLLQQKCCQLHDFINSNTFCSPVLSQLCNLIITQFTEPFLSLFLLTFLRLPPSNLVLAAQAAFAEVPSLGIPLRCALMGHFGCCLFPVQLHERGGSHLSHHRQQRGGDRGEQHALPDVGHRGAGVSALLLEHLLHQHRGERCQPSLPPSGGRLALLPSPGAALCDSTSSWLCPCSGSSKSCLTIPKFSSQTSVPQAAGITPKSFQSSLEVHTRIWL